jgi:hypothetical protein
MILCLCVSFCFEGVALPRSPELSKEMVILMKYQRPTHSKNRQILKIKKKHNYQKNMSLLPPSTFCFLNFFFLSF